MDMFSVPLKLLGWCDTFCLLLLAITFCRSRVCSKTTGSSQLGHSPVNREPASQSSGKSPGPELPVERWDTTSTCSNSSAKATWKRKERLHKDKHQVSMWVCCHVPRGGYCRDCQYPNLVHRGKETVLAVYFCRRRRRQSLWKGRWESRWQRFAASKENIWPKTSHLALARSTCLSQLSSRYWRLAWASHGFYSLILNGWARDLRSEVTAGSVQSPRTLPGPG